MPSYDRPPRRAGKFPRVPQQTIYVVYLLSVGLIVNALSALFLAVCQAFQRLGFQSLSLIITSIVALCGAVLAIHLHANVVVFAFVSLVATGAGSAYVYAVFVRRSALPRLEADFSFWRATLKEAWPMAVMAIGIMIYFRIDVVIISLIQGTTAVGFYSVAYTLSEASTVVPSMFVLSLLPILSHMHQNSKTSFRDTCAQSVQIHALPCPANGVFRHIVGKADHFHPLWDCV